MAKEVTMRVPQFGRTIPSFAQGQPEGPRYGRFVTQDRHGNPVNLAEIMHMDPGLQLRTEFPAARDNTLQTVSNLTKIQIRINWPGYISWYGHVYMDSLGRLVQKIAALLWQFLIEAPTLEKSGQTQEVRAWNITAHNITIRDIKLVAINHYKDDVFYCEFDRIMVRAPRPF